MKAVLFMNFAWHVFSGCQFVEVSRFERRWWKDSGQELGKRRRWGMMGNGTVWQPFGERSSRTGCVLALRWSLDKPFSMSEPPAEYKGFLSKKPGKLGWRDESCCILWMQKCSNNEETDFRGNQNQYHLMSLVLRQFRCYLRQFHVRSSHAIELYNSRRKDC